MKSVSFLLYSLCGGEFIPLYSNCAIVHKEECAESGIINEYGHLWVVIVYSSASGYSVNSIVQLHLFVAV